jgi:renalase
MTDTKNTVAIVGAGIAGLSAARELRDRGWAVTIFEKSADVGGRMATRTTDEMSFDHGVPCFNFNTSEFHDAAAIWRPAVAEWGNKTCVGTPNMKAPARALAAGLNVIHGQTVLSLARRTAGWTLTLSNGSEAGYFSCVVLAIPSPQATAMLAGSHCALPDINMAVYRPCWTLMFAVEMPLLGKLSEPHQRIDNAILETLIWNSSKPGRSSYPACAVVHATARWSRAHLKLDPVDAAERMVAALWRVHGSAMPLLHARAHRWRFAQVEHAVGRAYLWDPEQGLGACGDWCLGSNVEHAVASGTALARRMADKML